MSGTTAITTSVYDTANRIRYTQDSMWPTTFTYDASGSQQVLRTPAGARTTYSWTYENQLALIENSDGTRITYTWAPVTRSADEFRAKTQSGATTTRHFWDRHNIVWETDNAALVTAESTLEPQPYGKLRFYHVAGRFCLASIG